MITQARSLAQSLAALKDEASVRLKQAVDTGDLLVAWGVFENLEDHLPTKDYIIGRSEYPLMREYLERFDRNRYETISLGDMLEDKIWFVKHPELEVPEYMLPFDREKAEAMMWEVLKNGYAGFTYDW